VITWWCCIWTNEKTLSFVWAIFHACLDHAWLIYHVWEHSSRQWITNFIPFSFYATASDWANLFTILIEHHH